MNHFYNFIRGVIYLPVKLLFPTKIIGKENLIDKHLKQVTVSNHYTWADVLLVAVNIPGYRHFIAKKEIGKSKFVGSLAKKLGIIMVDRGKVDLSTIRTCLSVLKKDEIISIFPEGTRNKVNEDLQEVKSGAAMFAIKGKAPLIPIMIDKRAKFFKRNYIYVGKPFYLDEFYDNPLNNEALEKAADIVAQHMKESKDYIHDYVENKRWIEIKKKKKQDAKIDKVLRKNMKKYYRDAKKAYRKNHTES